MLIKKILVYIIPIFFFFSYSFVYSDSNITNPYKINGTEFNVSIEFYNYPLKLGEQFFDIQIFNNKSKTLIFTLKNIQNNKSHLKFIKITKNESLLNLTKQLKTNNKQHVVETLR